MTGIAAHNHAENERLFCLSQSFSWRDNFAKSREKAFAGSYSCELTGSHPEEAQLKTIELKC